MTLNEAIKKRILELIDEKSMTLTSLCLNSNITPSTLFDFMNGKVKSPTAMTIKKICMGASITLSEFFAPTYFNDFDDCL